MNKIAETGQPYVFSAFWAVADNKWKVITLLAIAAITPIFLMSAPFSAIILGITAISLLGVATLLDKRNEKTLLLAPHEAISTLAIEELNTKSPEELDKDWNLGVYFGHIKVIGDKNSPRYPQVKEEMEKVGLTEDKFEIAPCVKGTDLPESVWKRVPNWFGHNNMHLEQNKKGVAGCTLSHYNLIKDTNEKYKKAIQDLEMLQARNSDEDEIKKAEEEVKKYSSVLIIEDNNAFGQLQNDGSPSLKGMGTTFRESIKELPENWDMFYFISMHGPWGFAKDVPNAPHLLEAVYGCVTKCFAVNHTAYDLLEKQFEKTCTNSIIPSDHVVAGLHRKIHAFISRTPLSYRFASKSLVTNGGGGWHWQPTPR